MDIRTYAHFNAIWYHYSILRRARQSRDVHASSAHTHTHTHTHARARADSSMSTRVQWRPAVHRGAGAGTGAASFVRVMEVDCIALCIVEALGEDLYRGSLRQSDTAMFARVEDWAAGQLQSIEQALHSSGTNLCKQSERSSFATLLAWKRQQPLPAYFALNNCANGRELLECFEWQWMSFGRPVGDLYMMESASGGDPLVRGGKVELYNTDTTEEPKENDVIAELMRCTTKHEIDAIIQRERRKAGSEDADTSFQVCTWSDAGVKELLKRSNLGAGAAVPIAWGGPSVRVDERGKLDVVDLGSNSTLARGNPPESHTRAWAKVKVAKAYAGRNFIAARDYEGRIWYSGPGHNVTPGSNPMRSIVKPVCFCVLTHKVRRMSFIDDCYEAGACIVATDNGHVYTWGKNRSDILGRGKTDQDAILRKPRRVCGALENTRVVDVALGFRCDPIALAVTAEGKLFAWGGNEGVATVRGIANNIRPWGRGKETFGTHRRDGADSWRTDTPREVTELKEKATDVSVVNFPCHVQVRCESGAWLEGGVIEKETPDRTRERFLKSSIACVALRPVE